MPQCPIEPKGLQPPLRTEEFETIYHLLKIGTICQDLSILLIYYVQLVDISVLVHLAEQFDVLGFKGWAFAQTEQQRRNLIEDSVKLHREAGTPWAITRALKRIGLNVQATIENPCLTYDGNWNYDGTETYNGQRTDRFMVVNVSTYSDEDREIAIRVINTWQNIRSTLFMPKVPRFYDGSWRYDGNVTYDGSTGEFVTDYSPYIPCGTYLPAPDLGDEVESETSGQLRNIDQLANDVQLSN